MGPKTVKLSKKKSGNVYTIRGMQMYSLLVSIVLIKWKTEVSIGCLENWKITWLPREIFSIWWTAEVLVKHMEFGGVKDNKRMYEGVSKSFRTVSIMKYTLTTINTRWEATQRVMAAKLTRLAHKIAIQLYLVAESCTIWSSRARRPVRKLLDKLSYNCANIWC
jgi:hypothetical protein